MDDFAVNFLMTFKAIGIAAMVVGVVGAVALVVRFWKWGD